MVTGYIMWNPDPVLFTAGGMTVRWYGVMFATGLVLAAWYVWRRFRRKGYPQGYFDALMVLSFVLMFLGARLCHCLFYEPGYYLSHPVEMVFPVKRVAGEWTFTGFYGLASHGGAAGLVCAVLLLKWWKGAPALEVMDDMAIATPLAGGFIRTGNLINSEIVGGVTDVPWAFVFEAYDPLPRHPAQIYEGAFYLLLFAVMATVCRRRGYGKVKPGFYMGIVFIAIGVFRFAIEFFKEVQAGFERELALNMGQWLSVPFIAAGVLLLVFTQRREVKKG